MEIEVARRGGLSFKDESALHCCLTCCLFPLYLSQVPDEKYFTIYYYRDYDRGCNFAYMPYERFDYERWSKDVFHKDFKTVLKKHHEIFKKYGAKVDGLTVWGWNLTNCNISDAEQEIEQWRKECCSSNA